ncbi:hypothetical protein D3C83_237390 [compost metagenome]
MNGVAKVMQQLWRQEVHGDGARADERGGNGEDGFECHNEHEPTGGRLNGP